MYENGRIMSMTALVSFERHYEVKFNGLRQRALLVFNDRTWYKL